MSDNILEKAFRKAKANHGHIKAEEQTGEPAPAEEQSYRLTCAKCGAVHRVLESELQDWRTDDEAAETGNDDDSNEGDIDEDSDDSDDLTEEEREEYARDPRSALAAALSKATQPTNRPTSKANNGSKVAALKSKYGNRTLSVAEQILINRGEDPFED